MVSTINATATGVATTADNSGILKVQSNGVTVSALAWVCFDGTATSPISPRAAYNVSSVTKNSTGNFTVNFTNALADANYSASGGCGSSTSSAVVMWLDQGTRTTSAYQFATGVSNTGSNANYTYTNLIVFGNG
jgi:hypothetical protein